VTEEDPVCVAALKPPTPGLLHIWSIDHAIQDAIPLVDARSKIVIGREKGTLVLGDSRLSQVHAEISREGSRWRVRDLGSRNGTFVDGQRTSEFEGETPRVLRVGRHVFLFVHDLFPDDEPHVVVEDGYVLGRALRQAFRKAVTAAKSGARLLVIGATGTGKEKLSDVFHKASRWHAGPVVSVNCAAIPGELAESLFFGSTKGAYSGAQGSTGWIRDADGGVLFLDEVGELPLLLQPKLLRVLETFEVTALSASKSRKVDFGVVSATNVDLRVACSERTFRSDLLARLAQIEVRLPMLRYRLADIPFLIEQLLPQLSSGSPTIPVSARFVEACLLRPWDENVRGLENALRAALHAAGEDANATELTPEHLGDVPTAPSIAPMSMSNEREQEPERAAVEDAFRKHDGDTAAMATALGVARGTVYKLMKRFALVPVRKRKRA